MIPSKKTFLSYLKTSAFTVWILFIMYTWFVIIYGTNSTFTSSIENRAPLFHSINLSYYDKIHPWIYQDYAFSDESTVIETNQESAE